MTEMEVEEQNNVIRVTNNFKSTQNHSKIEKLLKNLRQLTANEDLNFK